MIKRIIYSFALFLFSGLCVALEIVEPTVYVSNKSNPTKWREICYNNEECIIVASAVDHPNPRATKYNKLVFFTTNPQYRHKQVESTVRNQYGMGKASQKVITKLVTPTDYNDLLVRNRVITTETDLDEEIALAESDLAHEKLACGMGIFLCGLTTSVSAGTGQAWGFLFAIGTCSAATFSCTRIATRIKKLEILRRKMERAQNSGSDGGGYGGSGGGPILKPKPPVPPYNPTPNPPGYEVIVTPVPTPIPSPGGCTRHPCPDMP